MPQMGVSVAEGTITEWRKRPGDWVENDEILVEISTDKVETEVPSPATGRVKEILIEVGETVDVGTLLATIETEARAGEAHPDEETSDIRSQTSEPRAPAAPVSPVVRRIADEHQIDLMMVEGTGRRGRVTKKDIVAFIEAGKGNGTAEKPAPTLHSESPYKEEPVPAPTGGSELSLMRKQIGDHMVRSLRTAAHCTTIVEADMSAIEAARGKLSYLPLVAKATIAALRRRVRISEDPDFTAVAPGLKPARVTVALKDGRQATRTCESPRGDFQRPYQESDVREKFRELASLVLTREGVSAVERAVDQWDRLNSVREAIELIRRYNVA